MGELLIRKSSFPPRIMEGIKKHKCIPALCTPSLRVSKMYIQTRKGARSLTGMGTLGPRAWVIYQIIKIITRSLGAPTLSFAPFGRSGRVTHGDWIIN